MAEQWDMVVVGAGWFGLAAAKVYIQLNPNEKILVLESTNSCGGTWAEDRLYPGLKSNNLHGTYEYPGFPMDPKIYGVQPGSHIPGTKLHQYLTDFAKTFGVYERMQFHTKVETLQPTSSGGWHVTTTNADPRYAALHTKKIILATGLTSSPNLPLYKGASTFGGPIFHAKDFCREGHTVETAKQVVVVGGAKSAYDVAYAYAEAGAQVDIVIRPDGNGPVWISHPWVMGGKKRLEKLLHVRWMTWFSPCPWGFEDGISGRIRRFLHGTSFGRFIVDKFWAGLGDDVVQLNGYNSHPELKKLHPWNAPFWIGSGLSIHNYDSNFFHMVRDGRVRVHTANISHLTPGTVHLSTGTSLPADLICCSTGWRKEPSIKFIDYSIDLPLSESSQAELTAQADKDVLAQFPRLKDQPSLNFTPKTNPFRLYRFMIPLSSLQHRNIAFAGLVSTVSTSICATMQALWIAAYLSPRSPSPLLAPSRFPTSQDEALKEIMLHTQWGKWRYPTGYGASLPDFVFDAVPYNDLLLNDLGVRNRRKGGWWREVTEPYGPEDYVGVIEEWREGLGRSSKDGRVNGKANGHANGAANGKVKSG